MEKKRGSSLKFSNTKSSTLKKQLYGTDEDGRFLYDGKPDTQRTKLHDNSPRNEIHRFQSERSLRTKGPRRSDMSRSRTEKAISPRHLLDDYSLVPNGHTNTKKERDPRLKLINEQDKHRNEESEDSERENEERKRGNEERKKEERERRQKEREREERQDREEQEERDREERERRQKERDREEREREKEDRERRKREKEEKEEREEREKKEKEKEEREKKEKKKQRAPVAPSRSNQAQKKKKLQIKNEPDNEEQGQKEDEERRGRRIKEDHEDEKRRERRTKEDREDDKRKDRRGHENQEDDKRKDRRGREDREDDKRKDRREHENREDDKRKDRREHENREDDKRKERREAEDEEDRKRRERRAKEEREDDKKKISTPAAPAGLFSTKDELKDLIKKCSDLSDEKGDVWDLVKRNVKETTPFSKFLLQELITEDSGINILIDALQNLLNTKIADSLYIPRVEGVNCDSRSRTIISQSKFIMKVSCKLNFQTKDAKPDTKIRVLFTNGKSIPKIDLEVNQSCAVTIQNNGEIKNYMGFAAYEDGKDGKVFLEVIKPNGDHLMIKDFPTQGVRLWFETQFIIAEDSSDGQESESDEEKEEEKEKEKEKLKSVVPSGVKSKINNMENIAEKEKADKKKDEPKKPADKKK
jgi:hypothetical protein